MWFYLRDINTIVQIGLKRVFIVIYFLLIRLLFPFEFVFSNSFASRFFMPNIYGFLHTPLVHVLNKTLTILDFASIIWVVGIIIATTLTIRAHLQFRQVVNQLPVLHDTKINMILHTILKDYKKPVTFQVIHSSPFTTPVLYGCRCPKIIVSKLNLTYEEWYFILKHEISHYYNRDLQIKLFVQFLLIVYWWNPLLYLLSTEIDKILEFRADLEVTKKTNEYEKTKYLDCLMKIAKGVFYEKSNHYSVSFGSIKTSVLSLRFHLILSRNKSTEARNLSSFLLIIPLILLLYLSFSVVFEPFSIRPEHAENSVELEEDSSFLVLNSNGEYDVYINEIFFTTAHSIKDSYANLKIYHNLEEYKNEKN